MAICMSQLGFGKLCARYNIRWVYSAAMLLFLVGSVVCGAAPNSPALIVGRAIAGLGSSGLLIGAFSLVPFMAPTAKRPILLGVMSVARGLATTFGPLIGGALTEKASWRWNFYINLPLGTVIQVVFLLFVHPSSHAKKFSSWGDFVRTLDLPGLAILTPSVICLLLGLQWGGIEYPWGSARIIALLVLAGVLGTVFIAIEAKQGENAMLPARVFTHRTVSSSSFFAFCTAGGIFVLNYYLPMYDPPFSF